MSAVVSNRGRLARSSRGNLRPSSRIQFLLAGIILLVAPLSSSGDSTPAIKLLRIGLSAAMVLGCLGHFNRTRVRKLSRGLFGFAVFYTVAAAWSNDPLYGFLHKGMFLASCVAGIVLAASLNGISDLRLGLRTMVPFITFGAVAVLFVAITDPGSHYVFGRLAAFRMNANAVGQSAAAMSILCLSHMVLDRSNWRYLSGASWIMLGYIIIETGSRGSVLMAVAGGALVCVGVFRGVARNIGLILVFFAIVSPALVLVGAELVSDVDVEASANRRDWTSGGGRMQREMLKDTRSAMWSVCLREWQQSPVIGVGWFAHRHRSRSTMNMYLQVLVECGVIGALILAAWLAGLVSWCIRLSRKVGGWPRDYRVCAWLSIGCVLGLLVHGIAESSVLLGTTANPLLLGYAVVMVERIPVMLKSAGPVVPALKLQKKRVVSPTIRSMRSTKQAVSENR